MKHEESEQFLTALRRAVFRANVIDYMQLSEPIDNLCDEADRLIDIAESNRIFKFYGADLEVL